MNSVTFKFRVPTQSKAYSWLKEKQDAGKNVSRALRLLIESHGSMFDTLETRDNHIIALKRKVAYLQNQDSPDYRAWLEQEKDKLATIRKGEMAPSTNASDKVD